MYILVHSFIWPAQVRPLRNADPLHCTLYVGSVRRCKHYSYFAWVCGSSCRRDAQQPMK